MADNRHRMERDKDLPELIRKELGTESNRRFLCRMSAFKPQQSLPDHLISLLGELDQASHKAASSR